MNIRTSNRNFENILNSRKPDQETIQEISNLIYTSYKSLIEQKLGSQEIQKLLKKMTEMRVELSQDFSNSGLIEDTMKTCSKFSSKKKEYFLSVIQDYIVLRSLIQDGNFKIH